MSPWCPLAPKAQLVPRILKLNSMKPTRSALHCTALHTMDWSSEPQIVAIVSKINNFTLFTLQIRREKRNNNKNNHASTARTLHLALGTPFTEKRKKKKDFQMLQQLEKERNININVHQGSRRRRKPLGNVRKVFGKSRPLLQHDHDHDMRLQLLILFLLPLISCALNLFNLFNLNIEYCSQLNWISIKGERKKLTVNERRKREKLKARWVRVGSISASVQWRVDGVGVFDNFLALANEGTTTFNPVAAAVVVLSVMPCNEME